MARILALDCPQEPLRALLGSGLHPVLARVYAARGINHPGQLATELQELASFDSLGNAKEAARFLADAIAGKRRMLIVADYDADGATACAVGMRALRALGASVDYVVPNRFQYGYGLSPEIVRLAWETRRPDILITVDNGIASTEGVEEANRLGMQVLVTDHHLPGDRMPPAAVIVNPNQQGCGFPSKHLAGVGVMFYVALALRAELRQRGAFASGNGPNLGGLLDLVALGTVADVVRLDENNRILVTQGLQRIRSGKGAPGINALLRAAGRDPRRASAYDLGFVAGPRLNAAGRLDDMTLGIECLLAEDEVKATGMASELDALNRERRAIEADMQQSALSLLDAIQPGDAWGLSLYDPSWHQGVVGLLASRIKDRFHRPVFAFAPGGDGELKGSGRSIQALHLRDALDLVAKRHPGLVRKFGGHAAAAGITIAEADFERFRVAFDDVARERLTPEDLEQWIATDGALEERDLSLELARLLGEQVWGQGFSPPVFSDRFRVESQRVVGEKHLRLRLRRSSRSYDGMLFFRQEYLPSEIHAVYRLDTNEFGGTQSLRLTLEHWEPA
jgi:single-stranded-DNA-specific exonuclease